MIASFTFNTIPASPQEEKGHVMARKMLVMDSSGRPELILSGRRIPFTQASTTIPPGCVIMVVDCSSSMEGDSIEQARFGSEDLARQALEDGHEVGVVLFGSFAKTLVRPTKDREQVLSGIQGFKAHGSTNMTDGINSATNLLSDTGFRTMIIVTDGMPDSRVDAIVAADEAKKRGISIVCVGTDNADKDFLKRIATSDCLARHVERKLLGTEIASAYRLLTGKPAK